VGTAADVTLAEKDVMVSDPTSSGTAQVARSSELSPFGA
jgi:hypothetical protein